MIDVVMGNRAVYLGVTQSQRWQVSKLLSVGKWPQQGAVLLALQWVPGTCGGLGAQVGSRRASGLPWAWTLKQIISPAHYLQSSCLLNADQIATMFVQTAC